MANGSVTRITIGSTDWSRGVNSNVSPTQASAENPNGLPLNALAWGNNITMRGGGISPRKGWLRLASFQPGIGLHQESKLYTPDGQFPYIISQIGGRTFRVRVDTDNSIDEITIPGNPNPPDRDQAWMAQGEQFMVIQDGLSLPLIWDGVFMRRSAGNPQTLGVIGVAAVAPAVGSPILLTLTAPFTGTAGQIVTLNGNTYSVTASNAFITLRNLFFGFVGSTFPTGTSIFEDAPDGSGLIVRTAAPFVVPPQTTTVVVAIETPYAGAIPNDVGVGEVSADWRITAAGLPPPGANQVYLTNLTDTPGAAIAVNALIGSIGEIPTAEPMVYYMGRLWLALGREYLAGDIVRGPSGTAPYQYRDSILKMTENTYLALGGTFIVPTNAGNIRALAFPANLNTALGEGQLLVFTREQIYSVNVVPTRAAWATLSEPIQRVAQINFGTTSDRSIVGVNGDLFFQSPDGIRSFIQAVRDFDQWGDVAISVEEQRAIEGNDRALLRFGSGIDFNNRLLQTCLPYLTDVGVAHHGLMPLNFDLISTLASSLPPAWEGLNEGLAILRVLKGDFGGRQRAFALARGQSGAIEVWEITDYAQEDENLSGDSRISWRFETPSYTWSKPFELKELDTLEIWLDRLYGNVEFTVEFRPDQWPCFEPWTKWIECAPRNNCEDCGVLLPCEYPEQIYPMQYRATIVLPKPPTRCATSQSRPLHLGYSFQFRISIKGHCRIRGLMVHAFPKDKQPYLSVTTPCSSAGC